MLSCAFSFLLAFIPFSLSAPLDTQTPLAPSLDSTTNNEVPTRYESTVLGRRLLALSSTGVISTIFPPNTSSTNADANNSNDRPAYHAPPPSVASLSIALPDYLADCDSPSTGNPTLLFLDPSTSSRNSRFHGPDGGRPHPTNISLSVSWWDQYALITGRPPWAPADLPRLSMIGYVEEMPLQEAKTRGVEACFLARHPDASLWLPGDPRAAHPGRWVRLVVMEVYWLGGFGDRHWLGWFDADEWRSVSRPEWEAVRLPGEGD